MGRGTKNDKWSVKIDIDGGHLRFRWRPTKPGGADFAHGAIAFAQVPRKKKSFVRLKDQMTFGFIGSS